MPVSEGQLQQALAPLQKSIDRLDLDIQRINQKLDGLPSVYLSRGEYSDRNKEITDDMKAMQAVYIREKQWANDQHALLQAAFVNEIKAVRNEMNTMNISHGEDNKNRARLLLGIVASPILYFLMDILLHYLRII